MKLRSDFLPHARDRIARPRFAPAGNEAAARTAKWLATRPDSDQSYAPTENVARPWLELTRIPTAKRPAQASPPDQRTPWLLAVAPQPRP